MQQVPYGDPLDPAWEPAAYFLHRSGVFRMGPHGPERVGILMREQVTVGRTVHYYDREEVVNAKQAGREPEPYAAIVTRVHRDPDGKPTDVVNLHVLDPEVGTQIARDVVYGPGAGGEKIEAHRWYWPPRADDPAAEELLDEGTVASTGGGTARKKK